jgi:hypothetical protein
MDPSKIQDVLSWNAPMSVGDIQSFLGLAWYYRMFIEGFSKISKPMTELLEKDTHARWSCSSICFTTAEEAWSELSDSWFGVSCYSSCPHDLEALPYGKEMLIIYGSQEAEVDFHAVRPEP